MDAFQMFDCEIFQIQVSELWFSFHPQCLLSGEWLLIKDNKLYMNKQLAYMKK